MISFIGSCHRCGDIYETDDRSVFLCERCAEKIKEIPLKPEIEVIKKELAAAKNEIIYWREKFYLLELKHAKAILDAGDYGKN